MGKKSNKKYSFSRALSRAREAMTSIQTRDDIDTNQPRSLFLARICSARRAFESTREPRTFLIVQISVITGTIATIKLISRINNHNR